MCYFAATDRLSFPPYDAEPGDGNMPLPVFEKIAAEMFPRAWRVALGCAAEPMIHPQFREILAVAGRYAAAYPSADPHVTWVLLNARSTAALRLESYRAVWSDPPSQQFLVDHSMQTRECTFTIEQVAPGAVPDTVTMVCENAGATLTAVIETAGFTIVDVSTVNG